MGDIHLATGKTENSRVLQYLDSGYTGYVYRIKRCIVADTEYHVIKIGTGGDGIKSQEWAVNMHLSRVFEGKNPQHILVGLPCRVSPPGSSSSDGTDALLMPFVDTSD